MFANNGERLPPCGVPCSTSDHVPSSSTPAVNHLRIRRITRLSPIRCSTNVTAHSCTIASKKLRTSASNTQLTFCVQMALSKASIASCGLRPGRSCLPAQAPLLGAGDHPASVRTPAELGSPGMHLWPAVLRGPGDSAPIPPRTAARLFRQLPPRLPAQGGNTLPAGCQRRKCDASARSTSLPSLALLLDVSVPAPVSRAPGLASGACHAVANSP